MKSETQLRRNVKFASGFDADGFFGDTIIEILVGVRDVRRIRSKLMELAESIAETPYGAILVLVRPHVSDARLAKLSESLPSVFRDEIAQRLSILVPEPGNESEPLRALAPSLRGAVGTLLAERSTKRGPTRKRSTAFYDVLRVLLVYWFRRNGPMTSKTLGELAGFSYPTIAKAVERLAPYLATHSDRSVELRRFPDKPWREMVVLSEGLRSTQHFTDRSGRPRAFDSLLDRLQSEAPGAIAIGGVIGARHYLPSLDLAGIPRLDLTISLAANVRVDDLMYRLDPALKRTEPGEPARVALHVVRQPTPLFTTDRDGNQRADEVDCILDLYEAKLDQQALELLTELSARATLP